MAVAKRSISFDPAILEETERLLEARGETLSGLVNQALVGELKLAGLRSLLDEDEQRLGPVPTELKAQVRAEWPD